MPVSKEWDLEKSWAENMAANFLAGFPSADVYAPTSVAYVAAFFEKLAKIHHASFEARRAALRSDDLMQALMYSISHSD